MDARSLMAPAWCRNQRLTVALLAAILTCTLPPFARAQDVEERVLRVSLPGRSIAALITALPERGPIRRIVFPLPGHPGIMKIETPESYGLRANFLIRSRNEWVDSATIVVSVDAPSDEWCCFRGAFRASERYAEDLRALRRELEAVYGAVPFHIIGTSEGSVSAYHAAVALQREGDRVVFTSSLFNTTRNSHGLVEVDFSAVKIPMLWVHHEDDPCVNTPYRLAKRLAEETRSPLITVRHADIGRGPPCRPWTQHGFVGVERETAAAIDTWLKTGRAEDVVKP
jgi:hypothetical protein